MAFAPTKRWKSPYITRWESFRNQNLPMIFADEKEFSANHHGRGLRLTHPFPLPNSFTPPATPNYRNLAGVPPFGATQADRSNTGMTSRCHRANCGDRNLRW